MKIAELLAHLRRQGIELWADAGRLRYRAPKGMMSASLRQEIGTRKQEILAYLNTTSSPMGGQWDSYRRSYRASMKPFPRATLPHYPLCQFSM